MARPLPERGERSIQKRPEGCGVKQTVNHFLYPPSPPKGVKSVFFKQRRKYMAQAGWIKKRVGVVGIVMLLFVCFANPAVAKEDADQWNFGLTLYGWYADIGGTAIHPGDANTIGGPFDIDASDIIDNLNMIFMGGFEAHKNKWSFLADVIYLDFGNEKTTTLTSGSGSPLTASVGLEFATWVVTGLVGYDVVQDDRISLAVVGGLRYTSLDIDTTIGLQQISRTISVSEGLLDGIIGVRGSINLNEHWYLPYYADIGTGDSDLTWQALAGIGYRFNWGDIKLLYRYLDYELDDGMIMEDLQVKGFALGVTFRF